MPKAKFKRKGASVPLFESVERPKRPRPLEDPSTSPPRDLEDQRGDPAPPWRPTSTGEKTLLDLPEEVVCLILARLDVSSISALEQTCKHMEQVLMNARIWRRILLHKLEFEPGLRRFVPRLEEVLRAETLSDTFDHLSFKRMLGSLKEQVEYAWRSPQAPTVSRSSQVFGHAMENHILCQIMSSGRYFVAFYGTTQSSKESPVIDIIDIFDRSTEERVRRLDTLPAKPDIFKIVEELGVFLLSYPGLLMVELVRLGETGSLSLDLVRPGEAETGSICDIVVRDYISIRGRLHRRVIMIALNTEPLENRHFHIGEIQFYALSEQGVPGSKPLSNLKFNPVPLKEGRFFNQCIQKKGLSDFNECHAVVVVGGCEGSAVLGVVSVLQERLVHKLQLKAPRSLQREEGCEGGSCQYSVVSLMIDKTQTEACSILLSTGQLIIIHLPTGDTIFHRHLHFDGQLKLALHQPGLLGKQRIGIKFRNFVSFYDLSLSTRSSSIKFEHLRTLRITSVDADGRETRLDDNPSQELRRTFGELKKRVRALNQYTSGIQKKLDKGLRPGTVTQGVLSMTKKVQLVTSKLDQAHGKAREIEMVVIASIAFDSRFCHALTLNRDLVSFDLAGTLDGWEHHRKRREASSSGKGGRSGRSSSGREERLKSSPPVESQRNTRQTKSSDQGGPSGS